MNIKKIIISIIATTVIFGTFVTVILAAPPIVGTSPAAPNAQCGTHASSGAFNFYNEVYGKSGTPGGVSNSSNSSYFGQAGGSGGGQTGLNNSAVCGNR